MTIRTTVNPNRVNRAFRRVPRQMQKPTRDAIRKGALMIRRTATTSIREPGTGALYTHRFYTDASGVVRPLTGVGRPPHRASAPGHPPASDTGTLLGSVEAVPFDGGLAYEIGSRLAYGQFLEFGTSKMAARPWLTPAWDKHKNEIVNVVGREMNSALKRFYRPFT